jgi:hypothetical protein
MQVLTFWSHFLPKFSEARSDGAAVRSSYMMSALVIVIARLTADVFGEPFHFADEPLHGFASPDFESALKRA